MTIRRTYCCVHVRAPAASARDEVNKKSFVPLVDPASSPNSWMRVNVGVKSLAKSASDGFLL